ncbi:MAG: sensor histidine kinase, partial [Chloroflexota bacterium]|nr:sensor histidine kinase [Chloroflexota bacterium]
NVGRHSGAAEAIVSVDGGEDRVRMTVMDDGRGFQLPEALGDLATTGRLGLLGMYERARLLCGSLSIRSELGEGTTVTVEVPA